MFPHPLVLVIDMQLSEIAQIVANRLTALKERRALAVAAGDLEQVVALDDQIEETQATYTKLQTIE
jgi:hypothetical protein